MSEQNETSISKLKTYFDDYQLGQFLLSCDYTNQSGWTLYNEGLKLQPFEFRDALNPPLHLSDIKGKTIAIISPLDYRPIINGVEHPEFRYMMGSYQVAFLKPLADLLKFSPQKVKLIVDAQFCDLFRISYPQIEIFPLPSANKIGALGSLVQGIDYVMSVTQLGGFPEMATSFEDAQPHIRADEAMVKDFKEKLLPLCKGRYPLAISWGATKVTGAVHGKNVPIDKFFNNLHKIKDKFAFININFYQDSFDRGTAAYFAREMLQSDGIYINAYKDYDLHNKPFRSAALLTAINQMGGTSFSIANFLEVVISALGIPGIKPVNLSDVFNYGLGRGFGEDSISRKPWAVPIMQSTPDEWDDVIETSIDLFQNHYNPSNPLRFDKIPPYDFMAGKEKYYQKHYADKVKLSIRDISQHWKY